MEPTRRLLGVHLGQGWGKRKKIAFSGNAVWRESLIRLDVLPRNREILSFLAPLQGLRIALGDQPPQGGAGEAFGLHLAVSGGQLVQRGGPQDLGVVAVGRDHAAAFGEKRVGFQWRTVQRGRQGPVEPVAIVQIVGPFAVTQQVGPAHLDLDDDDVAFGIDAHQVRPPSTAQRHLRQAPDVVACKQPSDAAGDVQGGDRRWCGRYRTVRYRTARNRADWRKGRIDVGHAAS